MRSNSTSIRIAAALFAALWASGAAAASLVEDGARLFAAEQREFLAEYHAYLLRDHDIEYRVLTTDAAGDINRYAVERFEALGVGGRSRSGRGLLLVIDRGANLVRLEVGYALEPVYTDAFVAYIEHRQMLPYFRVDRVADGILAATELIVTRAQRAKANAGFDGEAWVVGSGGGGATARAQLGAGAEPPPAGRGENRVAGRTPAETLRLYFAAMGQRNGDPDLAIYSPETRRMLRGWVMTPAQMDNVVKTFRRCHPEPVRVGPDAARAVIRYPIRERACAPWFLHRLGDDWTLDLTMMQRAVRFGRSNAWRFDMRVEHAYAYAFKDWTFDRHGFPKKRR
jgi:uncharacterized protein